MNIHTILTLSKKEWLEIWRDKVYFTMAFIFPFVMMTVLGFGMSFDVEKMPFVIVDYDQSDLSREYTHKFISSRYFDYKGHLKKASEADELIAKADIRFLLVIPPEFSKKLKQGKPADVQAQIDGQFTYRASMVKGYVSAITAHFNSKLMQDWFAKKQGLSKQELEAKISPVTLQTHYLYNNELKSIWSTGTGMIMLVMLVAPAMLAALGVVREKESGSIFNIYASTVTPAEFITGKILPYILISYINISILSLAAVWLFEAPFKGELSLLLVSNLLYVASAAGIGLVISTFVKSQAAAALIAMIGTMIPAMMYSGLMMPVASMAAEAKIEAHAFPAMYQLEILWGTYLKGQGWQELWPNVFVIAGFLLLYWTVAVLRFHKRVKA